MVFSSFSSSLLSHVAHHTRKAVGRFGHTVRKVGDLGARIARAIGQVSMPLGAGVSMVATSLGAPQLTLPIMAAADFFGSGAAEELSNRVSLIGSTIEGIAGFGT